MSEDKKINLLKAAKEFNVSINTIVEHLAKNGLTIDNKPNTKLTDSEYSVLLRDFESDKSIKEEAKSITIGKLRREEVLPEGNATTTKVIADSEPEEEILIKNVVVVPEVFEEKKVGDNKSEEKVVEKKAEPKKPEESAIKVVGKIDLDSLSPKGKSDKKKEAKVEEPKKEAPKKEEKKEEPVAKKAEKPVAKVEDKIESTKKAEPAKNIETTAKKVEAPKEKNAEVTEKKIESVKAVPEEVKEKPAKTVLEEKVVDPEKLDEVVRAKAQKLSGPSVIGTIDLTQFESKKKAVPVASSSGNSAAEQAKRKRKRKENKPVNPNTPPGAQQGQGGQGGQSTPGAGGGNQGGGNRNFNDRNRNSNYKGNNFKPSTPKEEPTEKEIQDQIKATLARLSGAGKSGKFAQRAKLRRAKRDEVAANAEEAALEQELQAKILKVTEFVTANELAKMMDVPVTKIISTCMSLGMFVSINQRLDAETLTIVADEFGYEVQFVGTEEQEIDIEEVDTEEDLLPRAPIVTVMGHVDHGKTSLLDFVRKANVIAGEAGGITQHIGAYEVKLDNGKKITFLDTPGHEAFTAMRARGAKVTDIVIIVIAADDSVMPQTKEAINHAQAAGSPIIFALNKIDKPGANPDKVREQLAAMNILVEEWGGKYQCQEISAKSGLNVDLLLEKVLLEAELLDLKANPNKKAVGTVIEAALDKGRGIITTVLVQSGELKVGDPILAGCYSGRVKALFNERGQKVEMVGPSTPIQVLGMNGAPQAGDKFNSLESEVEAREIANKRLQLLREQGIRTQKHITLDEIGRRLAIGNFKELNVIIKGDVDGSIEALSDSLLKLSTQEIQVNVIHKSVGQISESDVLLASASDAIIIGFQVRPSQNARKLAEQEQIDIRMYSIIYDAINELKSAMEGMLAPQYEEKIIANVEIRETFKITKVGTIAGCMVLDGKINRNSKVRIVRDGVVIFSGELASLKRFKDDVKEVATGYECGLNIQNFNDIKVGDIVEAYENVEVKRKL
ncbi:MAG: translation initiation factor IF-2 [bacterium]|jgi:translation initiation factor IF-2